MNNKILLAIAVLAGAAFSGCVGQADGSDDTTTGGDTFVPPTVTDTHGAIQGAVATSAIEPILGALVELEGPTDGETTTLASGDFKFERLAPGTYKITVKALGYYPQAKATEVAAGKVSEVQFLLEPLPSTDPWHDEPALQYAGFLECQTGFAVTNKPATPTDAATDAAADAAEPAPLFGFDPLVDSLIRGTDREFNETSPYGLTANTCGIVAIVTAEAQQPSNDKFIFYGHSLDDGLEEIAFDMTWAPRSASASKLSFTVEPCVPTEDVEGYPGDAELQCYSNAYTFTEAEGTSPVSAKITKEDLERVTKEFNDVETNATETDAEGKNVTATGNLPAKAQDFTKKVWYQIRIFTVSDELGSSSPADYGLVWQQPLDLYVTRFFFAPAPEGFSGIPDA